MAHKLLLRLPPPGSEDAEWLSIDEAGSSAKARQRGPLDLAAAIARSAQVLVIAPSTQILLTEPQLPPGSGAKLARAVPFALEEQLTEDIDQLVFALGKRQRSGATPVAVVSRPVLQSWLSALRAASIEALALYPDISLMPANPGQTVLWLEKGRLSVRRPDKLPFLVELTPVSDALVVAGVIADPLADIPEHHVAENAVLYVTREDWGDVQGEVESLRDQFASLSIQILADGPLPWLARGLAAGDAVNLLQGEFAQTVDYGMRWRRWRTPALLGAGLLLAHVAAEAIQLRQARHETAALDAQIAEVFASAMPSAEMHEPRRQMQARLERIRHSGPGPQHFLRTLQALGTALGASPKTRIDSMSYRQDTLDMKVSSPSLAALSQVSQTLRGQGLAAEIQSSTPAGGGVDAHLQVRAADAKAHR
ncbi:MAG: type II secretion system protein GspL [Pseudomonadota bacterium]|nr:type II secretion system protein GspL [Pseudomonadota bacterium]